MNEIKKECEICFGTGNEICNNPDHGFISVLSFRDEGRVGCPCCGHNEKHNIPGTICPECKGKQ